MSGPSDYAEAGVLNHLFRNTVLASPTTVYAALFTADPTDAGTGPEVAAGGYARQAVTFNAPGDDGQGGKQVVNAADVTFGPAMASWGTITHAAIFDALVGGNMIWSGALAAAKAIDTDDEFKFAAGELKIALRGA